MVSGVGRIVGDCVGGGVGGDVGGGVGWTIRRCTFVCPSMLLVTASVAASVMVTTSEVTLVVRWSCVGGGGNG